MPEQTVSAPSPANRVRIVVASTVMLTFISFWSAAAIVLNDLASSAFYAVGIAEQDFGKSAPWIVLGVMLFSFAVRAVYVESCSMFTRGGVYRIVKEGLGGTFAKVSVSALMFDYVLTGPVSGVSAGQYIVGLLNELLRICAAPSTSRWLAARFSRPRDPIACQCNCGRNRRNRHPVLLVAKRKRNRSIQPARCRRHENHHLNGGHYDGAGESSPSPTREPIYLPLPVPSNLHFSADSFGFLRHTSLMKTFGLFGILMAFGHTVLAMSGEETLAQVNREIQHPKLKNLKRAAIVIAIYSLIFTGGASLLAVMLIPDQVRVSVYGDNVIAGIAMYMAGPLALRVAFRIFVVIVGFLILAGAINTSIIGSTGVLMRVAEDGVLHDWFRKPQKKFGTPTRIINLVTGLQLATILLSRGNIIVIGEAYAFGVIWSFTFNGLAMLVLRYRYKGERGWKVPINLRSGTSNFLSDFSPSSWFYSAPRLSICLPRKSQRLADWYSLPRSMCSLLFLRKTTAADTHWQLEK